MRKQSAYKPFAGEVVDVPPELDAEQKSPELLRQTGAGLTLIGGGCRSGKSALAERIALETWRAETPRSGLHYLATGVACDPEMERRIATHRSQRESAFETIECSHNIEQRIAEIPQKSVVLLDSVTTWIGNLMHRGDDHDEIVSLVNSLACSLSQSPHRVIAVSDEVGQGIVPENRLARHFRDLLGTANQVLATHATHVYSCTMGIGLQLRPAPLRVVTA